MAIVANLNGTGMPIDKSFCTPTRSNAGTPNAVLTPAFVGERIFDTTNKVRWQATGTSNAEWRPLEAEVT